MGVKVKLSWTNSSITFAIQEVQTRGIEGWDTIAVLENDGHTVGKSYEFIHEIISSEATIKEYRIVTEDAEGVIYPGNVVTQEIPASTEPEVPASTVPVNDLTSGLVTEPTGE